MTNNPMSLPLYEKVFPKNTTQRALDITILFLLLSLLVYRLISLRSHGVAWFLAFLCESCFAFTWVLTITTRWTPMFYNTYPERLKERVPELPPLDMFVTTADPVLEPPMVTVNTVLSLLAIDYPANKLACYVSDDGCSPLVFYSLVEASNFAKLWVPFCKKYNVQVRAPFRYFLDESIPSSAHSREFQQERRKMKEEYERLNRNIEDTAKKSAPLDLTAGELAVFSNTQRSNHPSIVKVIWENKEGLSEGMPHLIYISREKRPRHPHHYKAGAMNVLIRVSGLMTNAPFMLNVDCDMYAHNPEIVRQAMCLLLGVKNERDCGFVQSPQLFYDSTADPLAILQEYVGKGIVGIQGPFYAGTGCFHSRKVVYGLRPDQGKYVNTINGSIADDELLKEFGNSKEFAESAAHALKGKMGFQKDVLNNLEAAHQVAGCGYECGSSWGKKVGLIYGSTTEDVLTGLVIHEKGWRSGYCAPDPPAFLGCSAPGGPAAMSQQKRWATGLLEILFSKHNPVFATLRGKLQLRQCVAYLWLCTWGLRSIPELCYTVLPAYCIITNSKFLPQVQEPSICIPVALFVIYNLYTLSEYIHLGFSISAWWTNQCGARIVTTNAWLCGVVNAVLKLLGISKTIFEVTQKFHQLTSSSDGGEDDNGFTFDESPVFIPGTTITLLHLAAWATRLLGLQLQGGEGSGLGELFCSVYVVLCFFPFVQGLFRKGKYGIPSSTIFKSAALALLFAQSCKLSSLH